MLTAPQLVTSQPCPLSRLPTCTITSLISDKEQYMYIPKGKTVGLSLMMIVLLSGNLYTFSSELTMAWRPPGLILDKREIFYEAFF